MALTQERRRAPRVMRRAAIGSIDSDAAAPERAVAADLLLRYLFIPPAQQICGIEYAAIYRFAEKHTGGNVLDVYRCGDGAVCLTLADINGRGAGAALHAGQLKYGMRAYASEDKRPRDVLRALNTFYAMSDAFEGDDPFASVFFARYDAGQRALTYASAGHEGLLFFPPGNDAIHLPATGPLVGVPGCSSEPFADSRFTVLPGSILIAVSAGILEARRGRRHFGIAGLLEVVAANRERGMQDLACTLAREAAGFARNRVTDDMAVLAIRFE